jgi:hypothetical protein
LFPESNGFEGVGFGGGTIEDVLCICGFGFGVVAEGGYGGFDAGSDGGVVEGEEDVVDIEG